MKHHRLLGTELPIIQAPMAGVQDSGLAIAVSEAGGLGSVPCAMLSPEQIESALQQVQAATDKPVNFNFFCHQTPTINPAKDAQWIESLSRYYKELGLTPPTESGPPARTPFNPVLADIICQYRPRIISFHFGLPEPSLLDQVKAAGCTVLSSATTPEEAIWLAHKGCDGIIAQGIEAGGHRGMFLSDDLTQQQSTTSLLSALLDCVQVPIIGAGGIADAKDVRAIIQQGAIAAQIGTSYLLCPEARTSALHRQALKTTRTTTLTNLFSGRPARGIINRLIEEQGAMSTLPPEFPLASAALTPLRGAAERLNKEDFSPLWSGTNRQGCKETPAAGLTRSLASLL